MTDGTSDSLPIKAWCRYSEYEIRGTSDRPMICPTADATLELYDPWEAFKRSQTETAGQPPYVSLFNLLDEIGIHEERNGVRTRFPVEKLDASQLKGLLAWCSNWGLLGLLPHNLLTYEYPPKLYGPGAHPSGFKAEWSHAVRDHFLLETARIVSRSGTFATYRSAVAFRTLKEASEALNVERGRRASLGSSASYVNKDGEAGGTLSAHFPGVGPGDADEFYYPVPLSREFWPIYGESVRLFAVAAHRLRNATARLHQSPPDGVEQMTTYLDGIGHGIYVREDGQLDFKRRFPSLLSAFAEMAVENVMSGDYRLGRCPVCRKQFVARSYQTVYCGPNCGLKHRTRENRDKQRRAREMRATGTSLKDIVTELNSLLTPDSDPRSRVTQSQIKNWLSKGNSNGKASRK